MKLIIGNRTYSSWSLRGWLACKVSALPFETEVIPMDSADWVSGKAKGLLPAGKVPVLYDGGIVVWDSLAIVDWLADKVRTARISRGHFWPADLAARALARSMCAEMHSGFTAMRGECSMNLQRDYPDFVPSAEVCADLARVEALWNAARAGYHAVDEGHEGPFLFGTFSAADVMFAPVCTRIKTYGLPVGEVAQAYVAEVLAHPWMVEWTDAARAETFDFTRPYFAHLGDGVPAR
ncbi:MAG: glutathione S-transferase family protein [Sphingomonadaceae bacterium]|nr:glutathione S-transferase family protein [Sphingomonadaceae bacterium]